MIICHFLPVVNWMNLTLLDNAANEVIKPFRARNVEYPKTFNENDEAPLEPGCDIVVDHKKGSNLTNECFRGPVEIENMRRLCVQDVEDVGAAFMSTDNVTCHHPAPALIFAPNKDMQKIKNGLIYFLIVYHKWVPVNVSSLNQNPRKEFYLGLKDRKAAARGYRAVLREIKNGDMTKCRRAKASEKVSKVAVTVILVVGSIAIGCWVTLHCILERHLSPPSSGTSQGMAAQRARRANQRRILRTGRNPRRGAGGLDLPEDYDIYSLYTVDQRAPTPPPRYNCMPDNPPSYDEAMRESSL